MEPHSKFLSKVYYRLLQGHVKLLYMLNKVHGIVIIKPLMLYEIVLRIYVHA